MFCYDLKTTPPVLKHFDFVNYTDENCFVDERFSKVEKQTEKQ